MSGSSLVKLQFIINSWALVIFFVPRYIIPIVMAEELWLSQIAIEIKWLRSLSLL